MLIDKLNTFSWETALTATAISDVIDLLPVSGAIGAGATGGPSANTTRDIGTGQPLYLHILVTTTLDSSGEAATLTVSLESDDAAALNTSATVHLTLAQVAEATLAAGYWIAKGIAIPAGDYQRYLGVRYTVGTENFTSGKVSAWLSNNRYDDKTYESGWVSGIN
jgi:hypothetical protein